MKRRPALLFLASALAGASARAEAPLRVGVERWLADIGYADALRRRFGADTGLALRPERGPSSALLQALAEGEIDVALTHAPALEARLAAEGLVYDGRPFARTELLIVGPPAAARALGAQRDAAAALRAIAASSLPFLGHDDGSGTQLAEQALWRAAAIAPAAPWFRPAAADVPLLRQAREARACCLVERPRWAADAGRGLVALVEGDPALAVELRVQRGLRAPHHAAQLFVGWLTGRGGRALLARGLRAPT